MDYLGMECLSVDDRDQLLKMYPKEKLDGLTASKLLDLLPDPEPSYDHVLVAPLTEIISIRVRFNVNHDVQHKIKGTILVTDGEGNTFQFYNRDNDNPETIPNGGTLTLLFPKNHIIIPSNVVKVDVNIKDADSNGEILKGIFNWNCITKAGYVEEINVVEFKGKCGSVVLDYVTFLHAVIARIDISFQRRNGDSESINVKIYGEIIARHGSNLSSILFDKKQVESVVQEYGCCIELSRHVLIVPALSSLEIYVKLFNGETCQQIYEGKIEFDAFTFPGSIGSIKGKDGFLYVHYKRSHAYMQPPMGRVERANHFLERRRPSTMSINRNLQSPYGIKFFEFYSVLICGVNDEDIYLCGTINADCLHQSDLCLSLFNKDEDASHRLLPPHIVPLTFDTKCLSGLSVGVSTRLGDANGRIFSSGFMSWSDIPFEEYWSLFNRHLCSIIRGNDGYYAAIHYSIFDAGVQAAMVQIYLNKKASATNHVKIDGTICAQYSLYDYSIVYNKEYYRRQLFTKNSTEPWIHCPDSSVILSESSVMVPMGSSLIFDVNLVVTSKEANLDDDDDISNCVSQVGESFEELLEFKIDMSRLTNRETMMKEIEQSSHLISVHVEWRPVY